MTEKRFENRLDKSNVKFNTLNPVWDNEKEDALNVFEMVDLLNELDEKWIGEFSLRETLQQDLQRVEAENEQLKSRINDYDVALKTLQDLADKKLKENEQLKSREEYLERKIDRERTSYQKQHEKWEEEIQKENEQLKQDNVHLKVLLNSLQDKYSGLLKLVHGFDKND